MKKALQTAKNSALKASNPLCRPVGGAELARVEQYHWVESPPHTPRKYLITALPKPILSYGKAGRQMLVCKGEQRSKSLNSARLNPSPPDQIYDLTFSTFNDLTN